jgi:Helix-turn-helix domain
MLTTTREVVGVSYDEAATRLGCDADWLVRVETGFVVAASEEVARILVDYCVRDARAADQDDRPGPASGCPAVLARSARVPADHRQQRCALDRGRGHARLGPRVPAHPAVGAAGGCFRAISPGVFPERDVDQEWDLLSHRQAHQPVDVTRLLGVMMKKNA